MAENVDSLVFVALTVPLLLYAIYTLNKAIRDYRNRPKKNATAPPIKPGGETGQ